MHGHHDLNHFYWFTAFQEFDKQLIFPSSGIDNLNIQLLNNFIG